MVRAVLYILVSIFAITFIRMVTGLIMRGFGDLLKSEMGTPAAGPQRKPSGVPTSGELKPCARCGTYVLASTPYTSRAESGLVYFCSEDCRKAGAA
jgi:hypothetical protein